MPKIVTLTTFLAIVIMSHKKFKGAVLVGILGGMGMYYLLGLTVDGFYENLNLSIISPTQAFSEFTAQSLFKVFTDGFDFSAFVEAHGSANLVLTIATTALAFCMVDMFDTLGTLYAACERAGLIDENGDPINMNKGMLSDAIATSLGAVCGTSTVTTFSEVNAGVAAGGRTGLTSVFCGIFFFIAMFLSPIAQLVPSCATAAALIYVGVLMLGSVKDIDWNDIKISVPAFLTLSIMPFTYNISYGIAFDTPSCFAVCDEYKDILEANNLTAEWQAFCIKNKGLVYKMAVEEFIKKSKLEASDNCHKSTIKHIEAIKRETETKNEIFKMLDDINKNIEKQFNELD